MGDIFTRGMFNVVSPQEEKERMAKITAWNKLVYSLYRNLCDPEKESEKKTIKLAREYEKLLHGYNYDLAEQIASILPCLRSMDQQAWVRLLLWIGKSDDLFNMFNHFKEISPLNGKRILVVGCSSGNLTEDLPTLKRLGPLAESEENPTTIVILPKHVSVEGIKVLSIKI